MSHKLRTYIRDHHLSLLSLFLILSGGTAYAVDGPLPGQNQVGSADIINGEVMDNDIGAGAVGNGKLKADAVTANKVLDGTLTGADIASNGIGAFDISGGAFRSEDIRAQFVGFGKAYAIPPDAIQSDEVTNNSLQGADIDEATLTALDGHDAFDPFCDPSTSSYIDCASLTFTVGRPMPVLLMFAYGFGSGSVDEPIGACRTTLDGEITAEVGLHSDDDFSEYGGIPVVDVVSLSAGSHTVGLQCLEVLPDESDIEIDEIRIAAVELGMD
jgi:hypothetical protein